MSVATLPILYSFRRCPYAMRARVAVAISGTEVTLREIVLRDKPAAMLEASPKGTVPVVVLSEGDVLEESLDIMHWALAQSDPEGWFDVDMSEAERLIAENDGPFKLALDRYKYSHRYKDEAVDPLEQRSIGLGFLTKWDAQITSQGGQLMGAHRTFADMALFPFVRQFANTDREWFDALELPGLQRWLAGHLEGSLFQSIMKKYPPWKAGDEELSLRFVESHAASTG